MMHCSVPNTVETSPIGHRLLSLLLQIPGVHRLLSPGFQIKQNELSGTSGWLFDHQFLRFRDIVRGSNPKQTAVFFYSENIESRNGHEGPHLTKVRLTFPASLGW